MRSRVEGLAAKQLHFYYSVIKAKFSFYFPDFHFYENDKGDRGRLLYFVGNDSRVALIPFVSTQCGPHIVIKSKEVLYGV